MRVWYVAGLCMFLAVRPMCTGIISSITCVLCRRAVRQRNWVPGEFIGACEHYTGEGKPLIAQYQCSGNVLPGLIVSVFAGILVHANFNKQTLRQTL